MKISDRLHKDFWVRKVNPESDIKHIPAKTQYYSFPQNFDDSHWLLTQEDFMRENEPAAHRINDKTFSTRPIYDIKPILDEDGNQRMDENGDPMTEWDVVGFEPTETVRFAEQKRNNISKAAFMAGNGFWISHEDESHDLMEKLNSWKDTAGLNHGWLELIQSCFLTGDGAIYQYLSNGKLKYKVFSYLQNDILFPDYDENHNFVLTRLYTLRGRRAVDIYYPDRIQTWIEGDKQDEKNLNWWNKFSGWFAKGLKWDSAKVSEDGWRCLADFPTQTPKGVNQCVYIRIQDIPSGIAEIECHTLEKACSFVADGVRANSQAPLFVKATEIDNLPRTDSTGKVIGVKGAVDELKAADAKFLTPPNLSDIATIDIKNKMESIRKATMSVDITPDIFRSADPSSASIKLLYADTIIWCKNMFVHLYPALVDIVDVTKYLVAILEDDRIATMRTSCGCDFWIPQNDSETLKRELDQVYARVKSRKAAMADIGNTHIEDYKQIEEEWKKELSMKSEVKADTENNETKPNIDNNAPGKSISE